MATVCDACGHKDNEVKGGSGIEPKGTKITLKITDPTDMSRDVLKVCKTLIYMYFTIFSQSQTNSVCNGANYLYLIWRLWTSKCQFLLLCDVLACYNDFCQWIVHVNRFIFEQQNDDKLACV